MTKAVLLDLALAILKEIAAGGPARAENLTLVVENTKSKGKTVKIAKPKPGDCEFPISPEDEKAYRDIDEAAFTIRDSSGKSPDVLVMSPQGVDVPLTQPDGYKTPPARKNLGLAFDKVQNKNK